MRSDPARGPDVHIRLLEAHDALLLDLDGVVYAGAHALPGAVEVLGVAGSAGLQTIFLTNNASRPPEAVAAHLQELGIDARPSRVVTSAEVAAALLAATLPAGSPVYLLGGDGLAGALEACRLRPVHSRAENPVAVVSGYAPELSWSSVMEGATLLAGGVPWVASNGDLTIPTSGGLAPGHGALVELLAQFSGRRPVVAGKPEPHIYREATQRHRSVRPLAVGDRVDTDIRGAVRAGYPSLLVMTGVTGLGELVAIPPGDRPTYVGADLGALLEPPGVVIGRGTSLELSGWRAAMDSDVRTVDGSGSHHHWWSLVAETAWRHWDTTGRRARVAGLRPPHVGGAPGAPAGSPRCTAI